MSSLPMRTPWSHPPTIPSAAEPPTTRVVKRLAPNQPGARRHSRRFGAQLICVRYRHDLAAQRRYTTVELIVDEAPIRAPGRRNPQTLHIVALRLAIDDESSLRQALIAHGAIWDPKSRLWYTRHSVAQSLGLTHRIV